MPRLAPQLQWLIGLRLVAVVSAAAPSVFLHLAGRPAYGDPALYWIAGLTVLASACYLLLRMTRRVPPAVETVVQLAGDMVLVTALLCYFGGVSSPFSILYLAVIAGAALLLGRPAALSFATAAWVIYTLAVLALWLGWTPPFAGSDDESLPLWRLAYNLAIHGLGFFLIAHLTSHLTSERRLRADFADLETVHRDIIESIPSGLITTDRHGRVTRINRAGRDILGPTGGSLVGRHLRELALISDAHWQRVVAGEDPARSYEPSREEVEWRRGDEVLSVGYSLSILRHADGTPTGFVIVFQDLTGWRRLQEELQLKDRMVAVGELAAGLAHEIGNPLAAISGSVQMLSAASEVATGEKKLLSIILKESQRLDRTIKGFLRFARPRDRAGRRFDIAALLRENAELLRNSPEVSSRHHIAVSLEPPQAHLVGDPDQISQIFWNLSRNALKAMPEGGVLEIAGNADNDVYHLTFRDTGRGMTAAERANLFHPFRSFFDEGSGIGMAIVYRIVQEHGGRLTVDSRPGRGSVISAELPLAGRSWPASVPVEV